MNRRITKIGGEGIPSVLRMNALEVMGNLVKSFFPSQPFPALRSATYWILQPVFVVMKILQRHRLRADVPVAERVVLVTANLQWVSGFGVRVSGGKFRVSSEFSGWVLLPLLLLLNRDLDAADRFAEIAGSVVHGTIVGGSHGGNDKLKLASGELKLSTAGLASANNR